MNYKTHLVGGVLAGTLALGAVSSTLSVESVGQIALISGAIAGSLFPDIDHKGSYIGRRARISSTIISKLFGHRGITHSPIAITLFTGALYLISTFFSPIPFIKEILLGFYVGCLSHIFLDMLTVGGVPFLYPFTRHKISLTKMKTGGMGETFVSVLMIGMIIFLRKGI